MSTFPSFIELLIKQTCRRASHEFEMGSKQSTANSPNIYSLEFLKSLYDKPRENIHKLIKMPHGVGNNIKIPNGMNLMSSKDFSLVEKKTLLDFLNRVKDMSPPKSQKWIDLQHYMHYVYRNFVNANPDPSAEVLSSFFVNEIKELVKSLMEEDPTQLYLRLLALLREYCIFAQWNYSKSDGEHTITKLFYYYEAMLSAAKNLSTVFPDFEAVIYKNYSVCWIDFNTCVFINYFFETEYVKNKIYQCLETKISPGDTPAMFGLLEDLKNLWIREQRRITKVTEEEVLIENSEYYHREESSLAAHKKLLSSNFWVRRTKEEIKSLFLKRLDHQIFRLLADPTFHPAGPILDRNGQCICEECLIAKYKCILDYSQDQFSDKLLKNIQRLSFCRRCQILVDLDFFHRHINSHAMSNIDNTAPYLNMSTNLSRIISEKIDFVKLGNGPLNLPDLVSTEPTSEKSIFNPPLEKDPQPKIANEPPVFKNTCDIHFSKSNGDMDSTKVAFEEFLKHRKETAHKSEQILNKNVRNFIKIKKDIFNHSNGNFAGKVFDNVFKQAGQSPIVPKPCDSPLDGDSKLSEIRTNGHKYENNVQGDLNFTPETVGNIRTENRPYPLKPTVPSTKPVREHSCRYEDEMNPGICQGHNCDVKEFKRCECTYCEVFGTSATARSHNELRDRLRVRLHQRREKRVKEVCKPPPAAVNNNNSTKIKTIINKVEERVPLPSSPTNIPPAPLVKSSDSSLTTSSGTDDIHGLVNYIEGNTALNKMELAEKKAAKKARQRLKKEEERMKAEEEQKRLAEEQKRKEAEKKKEQARKLAEKERMRLLSEAVSQKEAKKRAKKEKQAEKRQLAEKRQTGDTKSAGEKKQFGDKQEQQKKSGGEKILEETIPAMVTIKRVAENGGSAPTVTITLKGSTPDQDKLLYTLVNGAGDHSNKDSNNKYQQGNTSKKKNKKKQSTTTTPTVIAKELKVTLAVDSNKSNVDDKESKKINKTNTYDKKSANKQKEIKKESSYQEDLHLPMLRLPPGITITKVEGPVSNRNYHVGNVEDQKGATINVGKSGVIVVDTEKLIQNKQNTDSGQSKGKNGKKSKKKKNKKQSESSTTSSNQSNSSKKMITLKNPIFQNFQPKTESPMLDKNGDGCGPAAIFTNENGMVTIRSSRLQQSLSNGAALAPIPMMPITNMMPDVQKSKAKSNPYVPSRHSNFEERNDIISPFNAQAILSGLPGIEITKVDKKAIKSDVDANKACQTAQVSIIPASNGGEKFSFDKDDWMYDSVFTPRDVLEDDMDADELELEAFKRFCQQSIPPKRKEKVAHLNVADIVLKKKTDVNFF